MKQGMFRFTNFLKNETGYCREIFAKIVKRKILPGKLKNTLPLVAQSI